MNFPLVHHHEFQPRVGNRVPPNLDTAIRVFVKEVIDLINFFESYDGFIHGTMILFWLNSNHVRSLHRKAIYDQVYLLRVDRVNI